MSLLVDSGAQQACIDWSLEPSTIGREGIQRLEQWAFLILGLDGCAVCTCLHMAWERLGTLADFLACVKTCAWRSSLAKVGSQNLMQLRSCQVARAAAFQSRTALTTLRKQKGGDVEGFMGNPCFLH